MPTVRDLLAEARSRLASAGVATPALDARLLLQHASGLDASALIADQERSIEGDMLEGFGALLARRSEREPVSKIVGSKEFYGRAFEVSQAVLDPRPDSESLIALCLDIIDRHGALSLLDLGTGSGCLLLTLLAERKGLSGLGVDLAEEALAVAGRNATALGLERHARFHKGDWFEAVAGRFDLVLSNPPYIETAAIMELQPEVNRHDPWLALDGGRDGLEAYRAIAGGVRAHLSPDGHVAVEIGWGQAPAVGEIFRRNGLKAVGARTDLSGNIRAMAFRAA